MPEPLDGLIPLVIDSGKTINQPFPTTRWTLIARVSGLDETKRTEALEELCRVYWPPVYAFIRSKGQSPSEAEDLTQGFFADFLAREDFARPNEDRGKLRSFLLTATKNFMRNDWRDRNRQKRGGGIDFVSIESTLEDDGGSGLLDPSDEVTPEKLFERQWALTVLGQVLKLLRQRYETKDQGGLFDALKFVISPERSPESYAIIAGRFGMNESAVKVAAHRMKERYGKLLRETIADTLNEGEDVEQEIRFLMSAFG